MLIASIDKYLGVKYIFSYHFDRFLLIKAGVYMSERVLFPEIEQCSETLDILVSRTQELAKNSENVWMDNPHVQLRMRERSVTSRQIFDVLRNGKGIDGPTLDKYGDWRIKLKRFSAGRVVQVVVVVKMQHLEIVTVI